jgi:rfaE bifunctional protein kinase chain/domain
MKGLLKFLSKLRGKRIGVYGDLIADEYVFGTIHRFSREAPVFIVNYEESRVGLGGAANAVNNIHELGGIPCPFGVLGSDDAGRMLLKILKEKGIPTEGIIIDDGQDTFVKQRVVAGSIHSVKQQILRIDRCQPLSPHARSRKRLRDRLQSMMDRLDALIISDYGLGVADPTFLNGVCRQLASRSTPCFVDSRQKLDQYRGITAATPNEPEVETILGKRLDPAMLLTAGRDLLQKIDGKALLITRGRNGMALFTRDADPLLIPIFGSTDIVDVTGAGDTVISTFALAVTAGASFPDAARLSNCAAGIAVMKRGAATVTPDELQEAIRVAGMHE